MLKKGLRHKSFFENEICARYPPTIQFIELEEENERVEHDITQTREEIAKARKEYERTFRHERARTTWRNEPREEWTSRPKYKRSFLPSKYALNISPSELVAYLKGRDYITWPKKLPNNPTRDMTKYYEFHKDHGHHTIDYRALRAEVAEMLKKRHLREFITNKGREMYGANNEPKEQNVVQQSEDTPSPPPVRKTIGIICRGLMYRGGYSDRYQSSLKEGLTACGGDPFR